MYKILYNYLIFVTVVILEHLKYQNKLLINNDFTVSFKINIFNESCRKNLPRQRIINTIKKILFDENVSVALINIIFINNKTMKQINRQYLNHNYATDVISFCIEENPIECEIYVSAEIARTNAIEYKTTWTEELMRYVIHGILHIVGHNDFSFFEKEKMRNLEDKYLVI